MAEYPTYGFAPYDKMPPGATDLSVYAGVDLARVSQWMQQHWRARFEWKVCLGASSWPRGNFIWNIDSLPDADPHYDNIITAVTETSITCAGAHWIGTGRNPWKIDSLPEAPDAVWIPAGASSYDAVIEAPVGYNYEDNGVEWTQIAATMNNVRIFRTHVTARPSSTQITVENMRDFVTSKRLGALTDLIGYRLNLIKRGGEWPGLRWPPWAQAAEVDRTESVRAYTRTSVQFHKVRWRVNQFTADEYDLLVRDQDDLMRRLRIIANGPKYDGDMKIDGALPNASNDYTKVYFAEQEEAFVAQGRAVIVKKNQRYELEHEKWQIWRQYSGARARVRAVYWDGNIDTYMVPAGGVTWDEYNALTDECEPVNHSPALDNDMWSAFDEECGAPDASDKCYSPHLYKTLRMIQADQDADAGTAIEPGIDYTTGRTGIPLMTVPILYRAAGVNARSRTIVGYNATTGMVTIGGLDVPYTPITVEYTIHMYANLTGNIKNAVAGVSTYSGTVVIETTSAWTVFMEAGLVPEKVIDSKVDITWGRSRLAPRMVTHMRVRRAWIADIDPRPLSLGAVLDGRAVLDYDEYGRTGVGTWQRREPSTGYNGNTGKLPGASDPFVVGEYALWKSQGWNDPYEGPGEGATTPDPLQNYYRNFYDGLLPSATQVKQDDLLYGFTTTPPRTANGKWVNGPSKYRIHNIKKDLFNDIWQGGFGHVESGHATSGGTNYLEDTSKQIGTATGAFYEAPLEQWPGYPYPYWHFVIEIKQDVDILLDDGTVVTQPTWVPRLVNVCDCDGDRVRFEWDEDLPTSADDCDWRIREPRFRQNPFEGRRIRMWIEGAWAYRDIAGNDQYGWYFATPTTNPVPYNTRYEVMDYKPATVWKYVTNATATATAIGIPRIRAADGDHWWIAPRGADVQRTGIPGVAANQPFHLLQSENEPTYVVRYGRIEKWDQMRYKKLHLETAKIEDRFRWIKQPLIWTSRADPEVAEKNFYTAGGIGSGTADYPDVITGTKYVADQAWALLPDLSTPDPTGFGYRDAVESDGAPPHKMQDLGISIDAYAADLSATYAYPKVQNLPVLLASDVDVITYTEIGIIGGGDGGDPDPFEFYRAGTWGDASHSFQVDDGLQHKDYVNFFSFGDSVSFRAWQKWDGADFGGPSKEKDRIGTKIGSISKPAPWSVPNPPDVNTGDAGTGSLIYGSGPYNDGTITGEWFPPGAAGIGGYFVKAQWAVQKFDVPGGRQMLLT